MKKIVVALVVLMLSVVSFAEVVKSEMVKKSGDFISYQGKVESIGNVEFENKSYKVLFRLYDETGKVVWNENQELNIERGIINANLGKNTEFNPEIFDNKLYLTLGINGEETEKQLLTGSPYSMIAKRVSKDAIVAGDGISVKKLKNGELEIASTENNSKEEKGGTSLHYIKPLNSSTNYEYFHLKANDNTDIGTFMYNKGSRW